jgi:hypothetical protein
MPKKLIHPFLNEGIDGRKVKPEEAVNLHDPRAIRLLNG